MGLRLPLYLNNDLQDKVTSRAVKGESFASPVYRELKRSFELIQSETRLLQNQFSVKEWEYLIGALDLSLELSKVEEFIQEDLMFTSAHISDDSPLRGMTLSQNQAWAILDVVERHRATGEDAVTTEGLKKLGILCRED